MLRMRSFTSADGCVRGRLNHVGPDPARSFEVGNVRLPFAGKAVIPDRKIRDYVLNPGHPKGQHKARIIEAATGFRRDDADTVQQQIADGVMSAPVSHEWSDLFGARYEVRLDITGPSGTLVVKTAWIVKVGDNVPRFVTLTPN